MDFKSLYAYTTRHWITSHPRCSIIMDGTKNESRRERQATKSSVPEPKEGPLINRFEEDGKEPFLEESQHQKGLRYLTGTRALATASSTHMHQRVHQTDQHCMQCGGTRSQANHSWREGYKQEPEKLEDW